MMVKVFAGLVIVSALALVGVTVIGGTLDEVRALGACATPDAVIRYELAFAPENVETIFGAAGDACRPARVAAMDALNRGDLYFYVPAYVAFLLSAAGFLGLQGRAALGWVAAVLAAGAGVLDVFETVGLLSFGPAHMPAAGELASVYWFAKGKFVLLVINALVMAGMVLALSGIGRRIVAGLLCLPVLGVGAMYVDVEFIPLQTLSFLLGWVGVLVLAVGSLVRGIRVRR